VVGGVVGDGVVDAVVGTVDVGTSAGVVSSSIHTIDARVTTNTTAAAAASAILRVTR